LYPLAGLYFFHPVSLQAPLNKHAKWPATRRPFANAASVSRQPRRDSLKHKGGPSNFTASSTNLNPHRQRETAATTTNNPTQQAQTGTTAAAKRAPRAAAITPTPLYPAGSSWVCLGEALIPTTTSWLLVRRCYQRPPPRASTCTWSSAPRHPLPTTNHRESRAVVAECPHLSPTGFGSSETVPFASSTRHMTICHTSATACARQQVPSSRPVWVSSSERSAPSSARGSAAWFSTPTNPSPPGDSDDTSGDYNYSANDDANDALSFGVFRQAHPKRRQPLYNNLNSPPRAVVAGGPEDDIISETTNARLTTPSSTPAPARGGSSGRVRGGAPVNNAGGDQTYVQGRWKMTPNG
jgi:hypothetical protein